ncbi:hypothetical protein FisN_14Lh186 [Fistulifera solaris]|uniref:Uncharacterized protein n=1 Tax=Fistulifera solaris TaxID=1519565 RepID=A0A1Z5J9P2_FISSO|nr:hypothetical protein FisN_14Lh186 [Fistulifera solaris]|eukprot:GAX10676.1 hypothetical protein FisN_14Lh186 [Fistulifera solaris]
MRTKSSASTSDASVVSELTLGTKGTAPENDDDSDSSYETVIIRPARKEIVKREEEIEVSDYVTDSEAEEEARIRRENRKIKRALKAGAKPKKAPSQNLQRRAAAPAATKKTPTKPAAAPEKPKRKSWFNFRNKEKKEEDDEKEKADDEPDEEPEPAPTKPVERMKHKPKDYYHGFSRDHCDAAKNMKREWKHKSQERMEARRKAREASSDSSESAHEKILKRVVTKVTVMKEVEIEIPAETVRRKKQKSFRTVKASNKSRAPPKDETKKLKERIPEKVHVPASPPVATETTKSTPPVPPVAKEATKSIPPVSPVAKTASISLPPVLERPKETNEPHVVDVETGKKCYMWYARLGQPNKAKFIKKVQAMLDEGKSIGFKVKDVEALPWVAGGSMLSVSKMNRLFLHPEDLSDEE